MMKYLYTTLCIVGGVLLPFLLRAQPIANFSSNLTNGCPPIVVQFSDQSTGNPTAWSWNLGNGTVSNLQNPSTTYLVPGTYTVTLTVSNSSGSNTKTRTNYITVAPAPAVSFTGDSTLQCAPKTIQFTNTSTPGGSGTASYTWDFGDGNTSTQQNPSHTYATSGNYSVSLVITNSNGCTQTLTKTNYIKLSQKPAISFTASNTTSCSVPLTTSFTNTSTGGSTYYWSFGDVTTSTQQSPTHTYTTAGTYSVKLVMQNATGCTDSVIKTAFIKAGVQNASFTSADSVCAGGSISFTNTTSPAANSYIWQFGNGATATTTSAAYTYTTAGNYTVKLIAQYGSCNDTAMKTVKINAKPVVQFTANSTVGCTAPFTVQFSNTTTGAATYLWQFGDGTTSTQQNPSHTYNAVGTYTVKLLAYSSGGCSDSLIRSNYIKIQIPTATLASNRDSGCIPSNTTFTANINSASAITNYSWNFGDGSSSSCTSCSSISHTYTTAGTYTATLTYTTAAGCSTTVQRVVKYGTKPTASFTASPLVVCPNQTVSFTNSSTGATNYKWLFGDGTASTIANPTYKYRNADTYSVALIAYNNGCADTQQRSNYIHVQLPRAKFEVAANCANRYAFTFTDYSSGANTYSWNFGDGTTATTAGSVTHTYSSYGTYQVTLQVYNNATGCSHGDTNTVYVFPLAAKFTANDTVICKGQKITFSASSNANYSSYKYDFGNGATSTSTSYKAAYTYPSSGNYSVRLTVTDRYGCKDSILRNNYIHVSSPNADFAGTPVGGCIPLSVNFQDQSTPDGAAITSRTWSFGNGNTATATSATATQLYTAVGSYTVKLNITDANGCKDSITKANYVNITKPQAKFTISDTSVCGGQNVSFANTSTGTSVTSKWYFGDGTTSTTASPTYAYNTAGNYTVKLVVTDANGCKDSLTKSSVVKVAVPKASFTLSDTFASCPPLVVNVTNSSIGTSNYSWTFGNNSQSVLATPSTVYTYPGNYTITLKSYAANGCVDSVQKHVQILGPTGTFSYNAIGCSPLTVQFTATSNNTAAYIWDMNDGYTRNTSTSNTTYTYTQSGKFVPKLILSDGASCLVPIQGLDTVMADKVEGDFTFSSNTLCQTGTVQFTDTVYSSIYPVNVRSWNFGDGSSSTSHNPSHTYTSPGTYQVKLLMGNSIGCQDTIIKTVVVHPAPSVSAGNNVTICQSQSAPVVLQASGASTYIWSPATGLSCSTCTAPTVINNATANYTVIGTDTNGCKDTATVSVTINPLPSINAGTDRTICEGTSVTLQAAGGTTYSWSPATGLSCTSCASPVASPAATIAYVVTGTDANGCTNTDTILINVNTKPVINAGANKKICIGSSTQLQATGAASYVWSPSAGLSCTTCDNPVATPASTTTYTVIGFNANGCSDTAQVTVVVNPLPVITVGNETICAGSSVTLNAAGASTYSWSPATGLSCAACAAPIASPAATTQYTIIGTDSNGCSASTQATVTINPLPIVNAGNDVTICEGTTTALQATGAASYSWIPSAGLSCASCAGPTASPVQTTTYLVTGTSNGCSNTDSVKVTVLPKPVLNVGNSYSVCAGATVTLHVSGATTYNWTSTANLSCNNCPNPIVTPVASATYTVAGIDSNGCSATASLTITVNPLPNVNAGEDREVCENGSITLQASGASNYIWSPEEGLSCVQCSNPDLKPVENKVYKVLGIDVNGCKDSDEVAITVIKRKPTQVSAGDTICKGQSAQLSASGGTSYSWLPSNGAASRGSSITVTPQATTTYVVRIDQGVCFTDTYSVTIIVHDNPEVNAGKDINATAGDKIKLDATGAGITTYEWTPATDLSCSDCPSPVSTVTKTTEYKVTAYNEWGCKAEDEVTIFVTCDQNQIYVANTFTPNGDGVNDHFFPQGKGISAVKRFRVYNRWGQLMFDMQNMPLNNEQIGWDGTYNGEPLKPDVFVYILNTVCESGEPIEMKGDISLVR